MNVRLNILLKAIYACIVMAAFFMYNNAFATIVIAPNTIINSPVVYSSDTLDMSNGSFIIKSGGSLTIDQCTINGTISPTNPNLINIQDGSLNLTHNTIQITASGITQTPTKLTIYRVIRLTGIGSVNISGNYASVDKFYSVGFLTTHANFPTTGFIIANNTIRNFHAGIYLINSSNAQITDNIFQTVSFANIFNIGNMNNISGNQFLIPGNFSAGDTIDIVSSNDITVKDNLIESGTCIGVGIVSSNNVSVEDNKLSDGLTYAIKLGGNFHPVTNENKFLSDMMHKFNLKDVPNINISIKNNYITQNRYAIAGFETDHLTVENNYIVQHFENAVARKFWTNNANLLHVTNLTWTNNLYKEAFTQVNGGDNSKAFFAVPYPETGGVVLP